MKANEERTCVQLRALLDGPRGVMAEILRMTKSSLPDNLMETFSYLVASGNGGKAGKGGRRSRRSSLTLKGPSSVASDAEDRSIEDLAVLDRTPAYQTLDK
jgi:hypothetical protein